VLSVLVNIDSALTRSTCPKPQQSGPIYDAEAAAQLTNQLRAHGHKGR
jgi:hypothetical protein